MLPSLRFHACCAIAMLCCLSPVAVCAHPRPADPLSAGEIRLALAKLRVTGTVMYIAAHPDDENTAMLAWLARERKVRTVYLSMTRGDGGQNLIGDELGPALGVIRTQELLAARRTDGAEQMFTRALDFGFSKGPDETLAFWGHDSLLADVVWAIRKVQPDVIITRFPTDGSGGHGHHTASALLAEEAFKVAADRQAFPEQFALGVRPWAAKRLLWNAFTGDDSKVDPAWLRVDVGVYNPLLGRSYGEIAALSRSNHKSQGFGVAERHGALVNYLALREGEPARADLLDGVDASWQRLPGGQAVDALLARAEREFDPAHPQAILPRLFEARDAMAALKGFDAILIAKRAELDALIRSAAGLWLEAIALQPTVTPGESLRVVVTAVNRLGIDASLDRVRVEPAGGPARAGSLPAPIVAALSDTEIVRIPARAVPTQPYWLQLPSSRGLFRVTDPVLVGQPDAVPGAIAYAQLTIAGHALEVALPVAYRWADPVQGERWRSLEIAPPATLELDHGVYVFADRSPHAVQVRIQAQRAGVKGRLRLELPAGWACTPPFADVALAKTGEETHVRFSITPAEGPTAATLTAALDVDGRRWAERIQRIDYPHIPMQTLFPPASARLVRTDIRHTGSRVAYLMGPGDAVPEALQQLGYDVTLLRDNDVEQGDLSHYDAIVTGVRAYNTRPRLRALQARLLQYVKDGGTLLVQYNTTADGPLGELGPYPFQISRDRVTVEEAPVTALKPQHPLLTTPNAIVASDWDGWVQERGLYFANPVDPRYETPITCHDPGEPARDGGLLYAHYGKGVFEYCAYAMFRQLPAGVPGAWRLFANLVSAHAAPAVP